MTDRVTLVVREQRKTKKKQIQKWARSIRWKVLIDFVISCLIQWKALFLRSFSCLCKEGGAWMEEETGRPSPTRGQLLALSVFSSPSPLSPLLLLLTWARKRATASSPPYKSNETPFPRGHCTVSRSSLHTPLGFSLRLLRPPPCVRARDFPPLRPPPQRFRQSTVSGSCCCTCTTCGFIKFFFFFFFVFQSFTSLEFVGLATDTNRCHSFGAWRFAASLRFSCLFFFIPSFQYMFPLIQRFQVENQFLFRTFNSTCVAEEGDARSFGPSNDGPPPQSDWERRRKGKICPKESKAHRRKFRWRRCRSTTC